MASPESTALPVLQEFESEDMKALTSLPILVCKLTGKRHILWKDVKDTFEGIDYLKGGEKRALFMINQQGEVYVIIC